MSPHGTRILGFLTKSDTTCPVICRYARADGDHHLSHEVPPGTTGELVGTDGERVCVDEHGTEWAERDVIWASIPRDA